MLETGEITWNNLSCTITLRTGESFNSIFYYDERVLSLKDEFHITLIGNKFAHEILSSCNTEQIQVLKNYIENYTFHFKLGKKTSLLKKDYGNHFRYSSIIDLLFLDQDAFEQNISEILGFDYKLYPHMTIHSYSDDVSKNSCGIGIQSLAEYNDYCIVKNIDLGVY